MAKVINKLHQYAMQKEQGAAALVCYWIVGWKLLWLHINIVFNSFQLISLTSYMAYHFIP